MKRNLTVIMTVLALGPCMALAASPAVAPPKATSSAAATAPAAQTPSTPQDKLSYTLGYDMGQNFNEQALKVNPVVFYQGLTDGLSNKPSLLTHEQMQLSLDALQQQMSQQHASQTQKLASDNAAIGAAFLAKNKTQAGVVTLADGLQYKVLEAGTGPKPTKDSTVTVDYEGQLINGQVFDSSYKRGQPTTFPLSDVIPGWQEALLLMNTGSTWEIFIPSDLAYGEHAVGPIEPNSTLIFKVHLISIAPAGASQQN